MLNQFHDLQSRAGLIASECSLLGLGTGLAISLCLAATLLGPAVAPIGRDALVVSAGLVSAGLAATAVGHGVDLGNCRLGSPRLARSWLPLFASGLILAVLLWLAALWAWPTPGRPLSAALTALLWASGGAGVVTLAALAIRVWSAAATPVLPGLPLPLLLQAVSHTLAGGLAIYLLLVAATDRLSPVGRQHLAGSLSMALGLSALWASALLRLSRTVGRNLALSGRSTAEFDRAHYLASAATLLGLALPGLVVLYASVSGRDAGLLVACGMAASSGHVMRYAWVILSGHSATWPVRSAAGGDRGSALPVHPES